MAEINFTERIRSVPGWDQLLSSWGKPPNELRFSSVSWHFFRTLSSDELDNRAALKHCCLVLPSLLNLPLIAFVACGAGSQRVVASNLAIKITDQLLNVPPLKSLLGKSGPRFFHWRQALVLPRIGSVSDLATLEIVNSSKERLQLLAFSRKPIAPDEKEFIRVCAQNLSWRFQEALARQQTAQIEARFATLTSHLSEGLAVFSPNGTLTLWNKFLHRLTKVRAEEVVGKTLKQVVDSYPHLAWLKLLHKRILDPHSPGTLFEEIEYTKTSGTRRWLAIAATKITGSEDNLEQVLVLVRDISHKKSLERRKSEFISMATHELRTPLTAVIGYLSLMARDRDTLPPRHRLFLERAQRATDRLLCLAEDLLHTNQIEEERLSISWQKVNLAGCLEKVVSDLDRRAKDKGLELTLSLASQQALIWADERRTEQILANLIENALKYTNRGGVYVSLLPKAGRSSGKTWQVTIRDTGIGIGPKEIGLIFDRFHRAHSPEKTQEQGAGLGLFIVRYLVNLFSGQIRVSSKVGKGTVFTLNLPQYQPKIKQMSQVKGA